MPAVNPEILVWARRSAGLSLEEAAQKLHLGGGVIRLAQFEEGTSEPTRPLLLKMAKAYRRPLVAFYFSAPPVRGDRGEDFRNLPQQNTEIEPLVDAVLRDVRARQAMVRSVLEEEEIAFPLPFVGRMSINSGVGPVLASLQEVLGIDRAEFRAQGTPQAAFAYLRTMAEKSGVFVLLIGNLGSHHTNLDISAFRGFALADAVAPFVVINDQDARPAWSFTLLHELVHLWVGASGVSGAFGESAIEQFCNEVASEFLVPAAELPELRVDGGMPHILQDELITRFANDRLVSRSMVAYRLFRAGRISRANWDELATAFREQWQRHRAEERGNNRERQGGPNYYVVRRHKLGAALLKLVDRSMAEGMLSPTKAGKVLGVKARSVTPLLSAVHGQVA